MRRHFLARDVRIFVARSSSVTPKTTLNRGRADSQDAGDFSNALTGRTKFSKLVFVEACARSSKPSATTAGGSGPLYRAATLAAAHDSTPTLAYADTLGRTFVTRQDNGTSSSHVYYDTTLTLDVEGNALSVTDARANTTLAHTYCPTGAAIQSVSAEAGTSQALYSTSNEAHPWFAGPTSRASTHENAHNGYYVNFFGARSA